MTTVHHSLTWQTRSSNKGKNSYRGSGLGFASGILTNGNYSDMVPGADFRTRDRYVLDGDAPALVGTTRCDPGAGPT